MRTRLTYVMVLALLAYAVFATIALAGPHEGGEI